ncbi:hypothetical protein [Flavobacterium granuli]|uniref:Leucine-rich repeat (LRR) protein n=1 Tax=Flavobacterium granuli TaxID=280093 RepID=A0ABU1S3L3_9FLAO|nr:hypothetical protein [Flavobacterium granuli]MDR6845618.1 Leucine-rich repeat (LRR) protein [Flavobacterium granuli]
MKNIRFIIVLFLFVTNTNSLLAQEGKVELYVEDLSKISEQKLLERQLLEKQLLTGKLELNGIKNFPLDNIYNINKNIKSLTIENSFELKNLSEEVKKFKSLEYISISKVSLTKFPIGFCDIDNLTFFSYDSNFTTIIPEEIGKLKNLKILYLSRMPLKKVSTAIATLGNLERLSIDGTASTYSMAGVIYKFDGIDYIPKEIGNLKSLKYLGLEKNNLEEIPKEIGLLNNLTVLALDYNNLKTLPMGIYNLQNLQNLLLSNNAFEYLPEDIGNLKSLKRLNLENNKLKFLPKSIENLKNLIRLNIKGNEISEAKIIELKKKLPNTEIIY